MHVPRGDGLALGSSRVGLRCFIAANAADVAPWKAREFGVMPQRFASAIGSSCSSACVGCWVRQRLGWQIWPAHLYKRSNAA